MQTGNTRSNKEKPLLNLSLQELGKLERENRRAVKQAKMVNTLVLVRNTDGELVDAQGNKYNEQHQKLDAAGNVVQEPLQNDGGNGGANRTLAEINRPDEFYANRSAIRLPAIERNDFEVKPQYYTQVGQKVFYGLPTDNPMDHLERFEGFVGGIKANGVSQDYLFCKLFPHSLDGEALNWLNTLPAQSLSTWDQTRKAFLNNFYDDARSEELRTRISSFKQGPTEALKTCWMRFKQLQRDCPHHGFSDLQLISTFYKGIDWRYQVGLDSASNGNFMTRNAEAAYELIKNISQSHSTLMSDMERAKKNANDPGQLSNVQASLNSIQNLLLGKAQKHVHFADVEDADVNYIGGQQLQRGFTPNQSYKQNQGGYTRTYGNNDYKTPPQEDNEVKSMFEQLLAGQQKMTVDFNKKLDDQYYDINSKLEAVHIHLRKLDQQVAQTADAVKRQEGFLPGKTDTNPRHHVNAIYAEDEQDLEQVQELIYLMEEHLNEFKNEENNEENSTPVSVGRRCTSVGRRISDHDEEKSSIDNSVGQNTMSVGRRHPSVGRRQMTPEPDSSNNISSSSSSHPTSTTPDLEPQKQPNSIPERVYKPKVPYPKPPKAIKESKKGVEEAKCEEMLNELVTQTQLSDACAMTPEHVYNPNPSSPQAMQDYNAVIFKISWQVPSVYDFRDEPCVKNFIDKAYEEEISINQAVDLIYEEIKLIESRIPEKLEDPGSFLLNCEIGGKAFNGSMCDLGSSVNIVPLSVAKDWGKIEPCHMTLTLADMSIRRPEGVLNNVLVKIEDRYVRADFVVLNLEKEPKDPIILGRGFLATAGAIIDCKHGYVDLHLPDKVWHFTMLRMTRATVDGQTFQVSTVPEVVVGEEKMFDPGEEKQKTIVQLDLTKISAEPTTAIKQKAPNIKLHSPSKQRYVRPRSKSKSNAGTRSIPPNAGSRPDCATTFLGLPHAPTAYTPPWMMRSSKRHSLPLSDPPDI